MLYMLAPLEDTSDIALRTLCYNHGADLTFTEMTRFDSLARKNKSTWKKIALNNTPTQIQVIGQKETNLSKFLDMIEPTKGFKGINFNLGCPSPRIIKLGLGCAMIKRITKTKKLLKVVQDYGYPSSIKIRLGLNNKEKRKKTYLHLMEAVDCDYIVVHCRTGDQHYQDQPDYSVLPECVATGKPIIANGDITTKATIAEMKTIGVKGVMIGRAAVWNPAIFDKLKGTETPSIPQLQKEYKQLRHQFPSPQKYEENVLRYMGRSIPTSKHVQG